MSNEMENRLDRIEKKLDEVGSAIVSLARVEEQMVTLFRRMDKYDTKQESFSDRLSALERSVGSTGQTFRFVERVFWICATAGVTAYLSGAFHII